MQYESRGIPAVLINTRDYAATVQYTAEDKAVPTLRRVFWPSLPQAFADHASSQAFKTERVIRQEVDYILAALVDPLNSYERNISHEPESGFVRDLTYIPSTTPEAQARYETFTGLGRVGPYGEILTGDDQHFKGGKRGMDPSQSGHDMPGNRIRNVWDPNGVYGVNYADPEGNEFPYHDNHNYPNSWYPSNRYPFSSKISTDAVSWNALIGDDQPDEIVFTGTSYADVNRQFQKHAQDYLYGDGLPLIPPTRELVEEMLKGTDRDRDEVVGGQIVGRKGLPTVEKIAINAVMVGAKPEYLPILIGAVEAFSLDIDGRLMHFHGATSGGSFGYMLVISGAIVEELGLNVGAGYFGGAGNEANDTIGRAFRMMIRNLGHNWLGYEDTPRTGRLFETVYPVVAENDTAVPAGWLTMREQMGFSKDQNVVVVQCLSRACEQTMDSSGVDQAWTAQSLVRNLRGQNDRANPLLVFIGPAHAAALKDAGWDDVDLLRRNTPAGMPEGFTNGFGNDNAADVRAVDTWVVVTGEDPTRATSIASNTHDGGASFGATLITGAPLSSAVKDLPVPSTPVNIKAQPGPAPGTVLLTWDAPAVTDGRAPISHYEVSAHTRGHERWVIADNPVASGTDLASVRSAVLTHLDGGASFTFRVRAVSHTYAPTYYAATSPAGETSDQYYFGGNRTPILNGIPGPGTGVNATTINVYSGWDSDSFGPGTAGTNNNGTLGVGAGRGAIGTVHWLDVPLQTGVIWDNDADKNGVRDTGPSEVFWITAKANDTPGINIEWRTPFSGGGLNKYLLAYEYSTDNGLTWSPMNEDNGSDYVAPSVTGDVPYFNDQYQPNLDATAGVRANGSYTIEKQSADGEPLAYGTTYYILVRGVNGDMYGTFAGQSALQGANTAWPFQTHHRGPASAALIEGTPGGNNAWVQNNSRVQVIMPAAPAVLCEICGEPDCEAVHVYCDICEKYDCGIDHTPPAPEPPTVPDEVATNNEGGM